MSNIFDTQRGVGMSFREKSAWISFVVILIVSGVYFWNASRILGGQIEPRLGLHVSVALLATFVLLEAVMHLIVAAKSPREALAARDEREQAIQMRATRRAFHVAVVGALVAVSMLHVSDSPWVMGQVVLLAVVLAGLVNYGSQIVLFRRGR